MEGGLKIGELARQAGVTAKAIRFYERRGILPPATRAANRLRARPIAGAHRRGTRAGSTVCAG